MNITQVFKNRRTQYALGKQTRLNNAQIEDLVKTIVRESPSAFNSQSSRAVILFGSEHEKLWNSIVLETLRPLTSEDQFVNTQQKIASFAAGAGTILFFEDRDVIRGLQEQFPTYADKFPEFAANSAGMAQLAVWTALNHNDIGASLQHYNPIIDDQVKTTWNLPASWQLSAQMPFGSNEQEIGEKQYIDDSDRFRVFGA